MSMPTEGHLHFGYLFDDGFEFPWSRYTDFDDWWFNVHYSEHKIEYPYNKRGGYKLGITEDSPIIGKYYEGMRIWLQNNSVPIKLVYFNEKDRGWSTMITTKGILNEEKTPKIISIDFITDVQEAKKVLDSFLKTYNIKPQGECGWYLATYWND